MEDRLKTVDAPQYLTGNEASNRQGNEIKNNLKPYKAVFPGKYIQGKTHLSYYLILSVSWVKKDLF